MARDIVIGLDVGTSAVKIMVAENQPSRDVSRGDLSGSLNELHVLAAVQKPSAGLRRGYVTDPEAAAEAIKNAAKEAERISNAAIKHAYIAIDGIKLEASRAKGTVMVSRADGEISESDIKRAITQAESNLGGLANRTIIHRLPVFYKIDGEIILGQAIGTKGEKLEADALFITCLNQHLDGLVKSMEIADIAIDDIIAEPLAASYASLNKRQKEVGAVLVDIGAETTSLAVFEEGNILSLAVFPFGSTHITNDIALGLRISLEEAEQLKFGYISDNQKRKLSDIIEARLDDIFELIENHLKKIGRSGLLPAGAVLIGGGANLAGIENFAEKSLKLPVKMGTPVVPLKIHDKQIANPKWLTALGLCILGAAGSLDLEAENKIGRKKFQFQQPFFRWLKSFLP
jgi:cell division protein FtsA